MTKVVCMGDSITEGFGLNPGEFYPDRLLELLGADYEVVNTGVTSSTTMNLKLNGEVMGMPYVLQPKYEIALAAKGDIYVLSFGTNDAQDGMDDNLDIQYEICNMISGINEFQGEYARMIDSVKAAAPKAKIYVCLPVPIRQCIWRKHQEKYLLLVIEEIKKVCAKYPEIGVINVHDVFAALPEEKIDSLYQQDGLHPNAEGAKLIAETVYKAIMEA